MSSYTPTRIDIPTGLDELGLQLGLQRVEAETLQSYRRRLLLEARDPSGPMEYQYIAAVNRRLAEFDVPVFTIDLKVDGNGDPLAADPFIEITSTYIRAYRNYGAGTLDFEHSLLNLANGYFLTDLQVAFAASSYFSIVVLDSTYTWKRSDKLRFDNTDRFQKQELLGNSRSNRLVHKHVKNLYAQASEVFQNEVATPALVAAEGDFHIDYDEGVIETYDIMRGIVAYSYQEFPFTIYWQTVRAWPYNDVDKTYDLYDTQIDDDTGLSAQTLLNSEGARIVDTVLAVHPLGWGK